MKLLVICQCRLYLGVNLLLKVEQFEQWLVRFRFSFLLNEELVKIGMFNFRQVLLMLQELEVGCDGMLLQWLIIVSGLGWQVFLYLWYLKLVVKDIGLVGSENSLLDRLVVNRFSLFWLWLCIIGWIYFSMFGVIELVLLKMFNGMQLGVVVYIVGLFSVMFILQMLQLLQLVCLVLFLLYMLLMFQYQLWLVVWKLLIRLVVKQVVFIFCLNMCVLFFIG